MAAGDPGPAANAPDAVQSTRGDEMTRLLPALDHLLPACSAGLRPTEARLRLSCLSAQIRVQIGLSLSPPEGALALAF